MPFYLRICICALILISATTTAQANPKAVSKDAKTGYIDTHSGFAPHKALYDIKLEETRSGSQVVNVSGQMFYEWTPDCDGWNSNHRFNLLYEYTDSQPLRITSDFSTFESYDGKAIHFNSQRKHDGALFEEVRGTAHMNEDHSGEALYTIPKNLSYELPQGTVFPIAHSMELARQMKAGKKFYSAVIFDGSDDKGPVEINSFIGKSANTIKPAALAGASMDKKLLDSPARDVRLAFFPLKDPSATSDYEMTMTLHENSVISDMRIEYDDFTVRQKLIALEPTENACGKTQKAQ